MSSSLNLDFDNFLNLDFDSQIKIVGHLMRDCGISHIDFRRVGGGDSGDEMSINITPDLKLEHDVEIILDVVAEKLESKTDYDYNNEGGVFEANISLQKDDQGVADEVSWHAKFYHYMVESDQNYSVISLDTVAKESQDNSLFSNGLESPELEILMKKKATVKYEYSGSGDSGDYENITIEITDEHGSVKKVDCDPHSGLPSSTLEDSARLEDETRLIRALESWAKEYMPSLLESRYSGWENDDGASGNITATFENLDCENFVSMEHCSYYEDTCDGESSGGTVVLA